MSEPGTLELGEPHPMAHSAYQYILLNLTPMDKEAIASTAISGNRLAEVCYSTIARIENGDPVSDRYVLGLAWFVMTLRSEREDRDPEL